MSCAALRGAVAILPLALVGCSSGKAAPAAPPTMVEVANVVQQDTPIYSEWIAVLDGFVNAQIQPHVSGYIVRQNYKEGSVVRKGEVLFEIDPRPFQAALDQVKAQLAQSEAQLGKRRSMSSEIRRWRKNAPSHKASLIPKSRRSSLPRLSSRPQERTSIKLS